MNSISKTHESNEMGADMEDAREWHLTILLLEGLRLMRPEKAWRPIVTVEVDSHGDGAGPDAGTLYETMLGVDGQCVNQREGMRITDASPSSKLEIKVWHRSQSKKKKRRVLVASASCCLGELQKRQEVTNEGKLDVRLQCHHTDQKSTAARGRPQNKAVLKLRLRPPPSFSSSRTLHASSSSTILIPSREEITSESEGPSRTSTMDTNYTDDNQKLSIDVGEETPLLMQEVASPVGPDGEAWFKENEITVVDDTPDLISFDDQPTAVEQTQTLRRRKPKRRVKGFAINSEDECPSTSVSASESESGNEYDPLLLSPSQAHLRDSDTHTFVNDSDDELLSTPHPQHLSLSLSHHKHTLTSPSTEDLVFRAASGDHVDIISFSSTTTSNGTKVWIAPARDVLLPQYTEKVKMKKAMNRAERALMTFTLYEELKAAEREEEFEPIIRRLQSEWAVVGGLLLALAGVNTAMFTISTDSMFTVGEYAKAAIATSSVASGLGIACTAWFFLRYNWADTSTFISRSRDLFSSYFFFALSARVPALCMFCAACALTACLALIAFATFPQGVLILCFLVGMLMSLQFIVFGVNWAAKRVVQGGRRGGERVRVAVRRVTGRGEVEG